MKLRVYCENIKNYRINGDKIGLEVYYGLADSHLNMLPLLYNLLSDSEKKRADHFRFESDFSGYVSVHALLRMELSRLIKKDAKEIRIEQDINGKPFIPDMNLPFNLSRTEKIFAFVIGRETQFLGVDIEQIKPDIDYTGISKNFFSLKEQQLIYLTDRVDDRRSTFYEIWTRKEALLKAIGVGITTELKKVQVLQGRNQIDIPGIRINTDTFRIETAMKDSTLISIASSKDFVPRFNYISL